MKKLIAYYSRRGENYVDGDIVDLGVGNTEVAARMIQELIGGELFRIDTEEAYPRGYHETTEVARKELREGARPRLSARLEGAKDYGLVILGYPNWWGTMPMAVQAFLEEYAFSGATIAPFCTHEGSGLGHSEGDLGKLCPSAKLLQGLAIKGSGVRGAGKEIAAWLRGLGFAD